MITLTNELKEKLLAAQSAEEAAALVKAAGQKIGPEEAEHLWEEIRKGREQDGRELSLDELESVSGGADRDWATDGCAATVEPDSWCGSNDSCIKWDVTYDHEPLDEKCPNCGQWLYFWDCEKDGGVISFYRCKRCYFSRWVKPD